jgi:hypothetical protein
LEIWRWGDGEIWRFGDLEMGRFGDGKDGVTAAKVNIP